MDRKPYGLLVAAMIVSGWVGGVVGSWFFTSGFVFAEKTAPPAKVVAAEKFLLVNKEGRTRATLATLADGRPRLDLHDSDGKPRAGLYLLPDGSPRLALFNGQGMHRALLALLPDGEPGLILFDKDGKPQASFVLTPDGNSKLVLGDKDGQILWSAP
ncbi:MAG: hypothetical protein HY204_04565 [Nitrospirae bacterium]|nr:hypothetical protein [Nitrospirota bacterium]